jgi:uncharacterized protein YeaO (DUF488 family)
MPVSVKRVYEPAARADGIRVLVDRLWPRGLSKAEAGIDEWFRDIAPSNELRKWFHAQPEKWEIFRKRYLSELAASEAERHLQALHALAQKQTHLTLLYASKNETHNNAIVLKDLLKRMSRLPRARSGVDRKLRDRELGTRR